MNAEIGVVIAVLLAGGALFLVARPLRASLTIDRHESTALADLLAQRENAYQTLRDLDNDLASGRLSEDDYRPMRVQALAQAAEIVARIDAHAVPDQTPIEKQAPPEEERGALEFCSKCGAQRQPDDVFCGRCGHRLQPA